MTAQEVVAYFEQEYPGRAIVRLPGEDPTEIICEIEPAREHPARSVAVAAIKASVLHYHRKASETYEVLQGVLELTVDGKTIHLRSGDKHIIQPSQIHAAKGDFTLVKVTSVPGWVPEDHIFA